MALFSLPVELVLSVVEQAAWDGLDSDRGWVARLCLVCSTFRRAAMQPLYDTVAINHNNLNDAVWTASLEDTPFLRTRRVTFSVHPESAVRVTDGTFARAFANVEYLAASMDVLRTLVEHGQMLQCPMVFVTEQVDNDEECVALRPLLQSCTHLHILLHMGDFDSDEWELPNLRLLLGPRTTHLVVDPMILDNLSRERPTQMVEMLLGLPCERILFRMVEIEEEGIQHFCTLVGDIARERRDTRLWINDSPRQRGCSIFKHDCEDGRRGRALWDAGRPLYVPEDS